MVSYETLLGVLPVLMSLFTIAMIIYSIRVFTSKTLGSMVLAIDALVVDLVVLMVLVALYYKSAFLLIGVIPLASWVFLLDVVVARYLEKRWSK